MLEESLNFSHVKGRLGTKLNCLGPGLLMAGAAIGVSHLVQSTRGGAEYGFSLLIFVIVVNLLKYPFFEYGHRYAAATGESLLQGYQRLGSGYLILFLGLSAISGIIAIAGVTFVTAALLSLLTDGDFNSTQLSFVCMFICASLILIGQYKWLDRVIKFIMFVLFITSILALLAAIYHGPVKAPNYISPSPWQVSALPFLVALMGWMPAPIELSVWQSLWIQAKDESSHTHMTMQEAKFDFNFGYVMTILLAIVFLSLGALVMHGSEVEFANTGPAFAAQLVNMYTNVLGSWVWPVVAIAALFTMFSTTLTVIDAYPRSLASGLDCLLGRKKHSRLTHIIWVCAMCGIALMIIHGFMNHFKQMIDLATTIAFVSAPLFAYLNYKLILSDHTPKAYQPSFKLKIISLLGLIFLLGLVVVFGLTLYYAK